MDGDRSGFLVPIDLCDSVKDSLSKEQLGELFMAMYEYVVNGNDKYAKDVCVKMAFRWFKICYDKADKRYKEQCKKNRESAYKRWENERNKKQPKSKSRGYKSPENMQSDATGCDRMRSDANVCEAMRSDANYADNDNDNDNDIISDKSDRFAKPPNGVLRHPPPNETVFCYADAIRFKDIWNYRCGSLPRIKDLNGASKNGKRCRNNRVGKVISCLQRLSEDFGLSKDEAISKLTEVITRVGKSAYLNGENGTLFKANFDWVMKYRNIIDILEGYE